MSTIKANTLLHSDGSTTTQPSIPALDKRMAKAWVNFNGTGTVAIRSSYNVSSLSDVGTGDYIINFTVSMPSVNFCTLGGMGANDGETLSYRGGTGQNTVSRVRVAHKNLSNAYVDGSLISVAVLSS